MVVERLQKLQQTYALEQDANKKQELLEQILALIRVGWEQLFAALSKGEDPQQLILLVADLNRVFEQREHLEKSHTAPTDESHG